MPARARLCSSGKYHDIEVEDDVTAYVEHERGDGCLYYEHRRGARLQQLRDHGDRGRLVLE